MDLTLSGGPSRNCTRFLFPRHRNGAQLSWSSVASKAIPTSTRTRDFLLDFAELKQENVLLLPVHAQEVDIWLDAALRTSRMLAFGGTMMVSGKGINSDHQSQSGLGEPDALRPWSKGLILPCAEKHINVDMADLICDAKQGRPPSAKSIH